MGWNFGSRTGRFDVTDFDAPNTGGIGFGGADACPWHCGMCATLAGNRFGGDLSGSGRRSIGALSGRAVGSLLGSPGPGQIPNGVIGNWTIANDTGHYATAIAKH